MQKLRFVITMMALGFAVCAKTQDIIVKKDGNTIVSKVLEVSDTQVKYKKASNLDGPTYTINISELVGINYQNGEKENFKTSDSAPNQKAEPAADNEEQKARYASLPRLNLKPSNKKSKGFFPIMAFTESSVISTNELLVIIDPTPVEYYDSGWKVKLGYSIQFVNKTDEPIYIDRANCFRRFNNYDMKSYFNNKQVTVSHSNGNAGGVGVGLGSVSLGIGASSSSTYSDSYGVDRFLILGPRSKANLVDYKYIRLSEKKAEFRTVSDIEYWGFSIRNFSINQGEVKTYTEDNTLYSNRYYIKYSTDENFSTSYVLEFELYAKYIVGAIIKPWRWSALDPRGRIIKEIQGVVPDFWTDSMNIIGTPN